MPARRLEPVERLDHPGEEEALVGDMRLVMGEKIPEQLLQTGRRERNLLRREAALDQRLGARAQHEAGLRQVDRRDIFAREDEIQRSDQVAGGFGKRAVKVEDQKFPWVHELGL